MSNVLALSGGIDSSAVLATLPIDLAVYVDYGQAAAVQERNAARLMAQKFETPLQETRIEGLDIGSMNDAPGVSGPRVVQARNAIILSICANHAPPGSVVYLGAHKDDSKNYPDCRPEFIGAMTQAFLDAYGVTVRAPFQLMTKRQVRDTLASVLRDFNFCWSCYAPTDTGQPCGACDSCMSNAAEG